MTQPRLAVRAIILRDDRLLLVNAFPGRRSDLWCAPGGGVEPNASLPENLAREVREETGLSITVGAFAGAREFARDDGSFHQVELFFHAEAEGDISPEWRDPTGVVHMRGWFGRDDLDAMRVEPEILRTLPFDGGLPSYWGMKAMLKR